MQICVAVDTASSACALGFSLKIFQDHEIVSEKEGDIKSPPDLNLKIQWFASRISCAKNFKCSRGPGCPGNKVLFLSHLNVDEREMVSRCNI